MNETVEIRVEVENDATYIWEGSDAEARYEQWALDGAETYDSAEPLDG